MKIPANKDIFPSNDRMAGKHVSQFALSLKKMPEKYKRQFSQYAKAGLEPEKLEEHFIETQNKMREAFKDTVKLANFEETAQGFLEGK
jgi:hypothetical protein